MNRLLPILSLLPALSACGTADSADVPAETRQVVQPVAVRTQPMKQVTQPKVLALDGTVRAARRASLSPQISGHVASVEVERGDVVKAGDPLITLESKELRLAAESASARAEVQRRLISNSKGSTLDVDQLAEVRQAQIRYDNLKQRMKRLKQLHSRGAVDDQSFEDAESELASAKAALMAAEQRGKSNIAQLRALRSDVAQRREQLDDAVLRAPFAGAVVSRTVEVGEFVNSNSAVVELVDTSSLRVEIKVPERDAPKVHQGQPATIHVDGYDAPLTGEVRFVAAALDPTSRALTVEIVAANPERKVRAGHFARVQLRLDGSEAYWQVPKTALRERAGVARLYVADGEQARAVLVRAVGEQGEQALVTGALKADQRLIAEVPDNLTDGTPIKVEQ